MWKTKLYLCSSAEINLRGTQVHLAWARVIATIKLHQKSETVSSRRIVVGLLNE